MEEQTIVNEQQKEEIDTTINTPPQTEETMVTEFEDLSVEEDDLDNIEAVETQPEEKNIVMTAEDFVMREYIKNPKVGESIEFTIDNIKTITDKSKHYAINKTTGKRFCTGVEKKDGTTIKLEVYTDDGKIFGINSWGLFYLFRGSTSVFAQKVKELKQIQGISVKITRNYDGSVPNKSSDDVMKLYDFSTIEEAKAYQKEVAKALEDGKLFTLEIINK